VTADASLRVEESLQPASRLVFLDALRVGIIVMVIIHHAAQAYGPTGGAWPVTDTAQSDWFRPFYTVNASVGLGLLFLVAGYLIPRSYDRKGAGRFLSERWKRLGVPLLVFTLVVHLPALYLFLSRPPLDEFVALVWDSGLQILYLHLWFLGLLLLFSVSYAAWRKARDIERRPPRALQPPTHRSIIAFVTILALVTWIVRWWYPIDEWVPLLFVFAVEPANLPQYVSLFAIGTLAYRNDWFRRIPRHVGMVWLAVGLTSAASIYVLEAFGKWDDLVATGGASPRALALTTLSASIAVGLSVGLVVLLRETIHRPHRLLTVMATASYAAYILHLWVVSGLQAGLLAVDLPVFAKFALVTVVGVALSFVIGSFSSNVPGLRVILGTRRPQVTSRSYTETP
jgi:fucose 4-O-acetylase-like acetyltransferase